MNNLKNEIHDYWTNRARGYSEYNQQEMADARRTMWRDKLLSLLGNQFPEKKPQEIKILDVGTGPGFFAILLAEAGYQVTAIDYTEEMLKEAQSNAGELTKCIVWKTGDTQALDVESNSFDVIVTRNVTWNLPRPDLAYKEWLRVLKPGGMLYNFDADWYGHLYNEEKRSSYEKDRQQTEEQNVEDYYRGTDIEKMEEIARQVPLSRLERPKWDIETMQKTGFLDVSCDEEVWKEVWTEEEIINNSTHIMNRERIGQVRGVPFLAPVIDTIKQLGRYTEAEVLAAVINGLFTVFIEKESASDDVPFGESIPEEMQVDQEDENSIELAPGAVIDLGEGEKANMVNPGRPNPNFDPFVIAVLKQIGAALEIPYEILIMAFSSNYSASRAAILEFFKVVKMYRAWFVADFCQPIYEEWLSEAVAKGRIKAPGFFTDPIIKDAYCSAEWTGPSAGQLDPTKEVEAAEKRVQGGYSTREREARELTGTDFYKNIKQRKREEELLKEVTGGAKTDTQTVEDINGREESDRENNPGNGGEQIKEKKAGFFVLTSLDDIAWLLNIRGNDIHCCPVVLSYLIMTDTELRLYANVGAFAEKIRENLEADGVKIYPYNEVYSYVQARIKFLPI